MISVKVHQIVGRAIKERWAWAFEKNQVFFLSRHLNMTQRQSMSSSQEFPLSLPLLFNKEIYQQLKMMLSAATQPTVNWAPAFFSQKYFSPKIVSFTKQQQSLSRPFNVSALKPRRNLGVFATSAVSFAEETSTQDSVSSAPLQKEVILVQFFTFLLNCVN